LTIQSQTEQKIRQMPGISVKDQTTLAKKKQANQRPFT